MATYSPSQLRRKFNQLWVMSYNRLIAVVDEKSGEVMYIEDYGPRDGFFIEGWRALHFPLTSPLVKKSYREGTKTIYIVSQGKTKLNLTPSFAPIGIEECRVRDDEVVITFAGIGGGGVSAAYSRGMADGVIKTKIIQGGGGNRLGIGQICLPKKHFLLIGVDDTDNENEGATYSLVHNIVDKICKKHRAFYATHNNVQLYPHNPHKTKNCMSTVVGIIGDSNVKRTITNEVVKDLLKHSLSDQVGVAVYDGFSLPVKLKRLCYEAKFRMFSDPKGLYKIAIETGVKLYPNPDHRGLIGAVAALGFFDDPEFAAQLPPYST